jgi:sulfide:quinone oxidoreductase
MLEDGTRIEADLFMFIAAGDGHGVVKASDLPLNEAGFVQTQPTCEVRGYPWLYAIGDAAAQDIARKVSRRGVPGSYLDEVCILCVMDMGNGAGFVCRDDRRALFIPLPIVGHWLKKSRGKYYELCKLGKVPRILGM